MSSNIRHSSDSPRWGTNPDVIKIGHAVLCGALNQPKIYVDPFSEEEFNAHVGAYRILDGSKGKDGYRDRWIEDWNTDEQRCPRADHLLSGIYQPVAPVGYEVTMSLSPDECDSLGDSLPSVKPTALVNPPSSEDGENVKNAYRIVELMWRLGWFPGGVLWVGFNLNQFQTLQRKEDPHYLSPLADRFLRCIPDHRLPYTAHSSRPATRVNKHGETVDNDDAPSHPSFFLLMPAYDVALAAEQGRLFDSMGSQLGEVF